MVPVMTVEWTKKEWLNSEIYLKSIARVYLKCIKYKKLKSFSIVENDCVPLVNDQMNYFDNLKKTEKQI